MPGQFTCPAQFKSPGVPAKGTSLCGAPKQLEELNIVCTKKDDETVG